MRAELGTAISTQVVRFICINTADDGMGRRDASVRLLGIHDPTIFPTAMRNVNRPVMTLGDVIRME